MGRVSRTALVALATSALLLSTVPALPALADAAELTIIDLPSAGLGQVAIDGDTLFAQDSASGAIDEYSLSFDTGTASDPARLGSGRRFVAGEGQVAWDARSWTLASRNDEDSVSQVYSDEIFPTAIVKGWLIDRGTYLVNLASGDREFLGYSGTLLDGVVYRPVHSWPSAGPLISRDLTTGATESVPVPASCTGLKGVQAAGSWMALDCAGVTWIVDRTGAVEPFSAEVGTGTVLLGNGFITVLTGSTLSWSPLADGSIDLSPVSTTATKSAVSRGSVPTIAWTDETGSARAALLPVTGTPLPAHPAGPTAPPSPPTVTETHTARTVTLDWTGGAETEAVSGFWVSGFGGGRSAGPGSVFLPPTATSHTFADLQPGTPYDFRVLAVNSAGLSPDRRFTATPLYPYLGYGGVSSADYVEDTGVLTVTWSYGRFPLYESVDFFDVSFGGQSITSLPSTTRSATFSVPGAVRGDIVTVTAHGHGITERWTRAIETDEDSVLPTAAIANLAPVTLGSLLTASVAATDNRAVSSVDVRVRSSSGPSKAIGAWTYPAALQAVPAPYAVTLAVKAGATYCLSARARDTKANLSAWSPEVCSASALDDSALKKSGSWQKLKSTKYFKGSSLRPRNSKSALSTPVRSSAIYIVATTCPTCGKVGVAYGKYATFMVDLRSATTRHRQIIKAYGPDRYTGTVSVVKWGSSKAAVDGIAIVGR